MEVQLTPAEVNLLMSILEEQHRELEHQICHTDHREFRLILQQQKQLVEALIEKLTPFAGRSSLPEAVALDS